VVADLQASHVGERDQHQHRQDAPTITLREPVAATECLGWNTTDVTDHRADGLSRPPLRP
jgi:hypothetical protein